MRDNAPDDMFSGSATLPDTAWHVCMPYTDMLRRGRRWMLWVCNNGSQPLSVQFTASPDGSCPDADSTDVKTCPVGQAVSCYGDGLHRYWAISIQGAAGTAYSWGVTLDYKD